MDPRPEASPRRAPRAKSAPPAFEAVFRRHYAFVWRNLARLGVPDAALDDALQDVFVVVHRRLPQFVHRGSMRGWLFQIVRRIAWRHRQAHQRAARTETLDRLESAEPITDREAEAELERRDALRRLDRWLAELDEDKRCAFILSELEEFRGPEIARQLGVNVNTVYARVRAARLHVQRRARRLTTVEDVGRLRAVHQRDRPSGDRRRQLMAALAVKTSPLLAPTSAASAGVIKIAIASVLVAVTGVAVATADRGPDDAVDSRPTVAETERMPSKPRVGAPVSREPIPAPTHGEEQRPPEPIQSIQSTPTPRPVAPVNDTRPAASVDRPAPSSGSTSTDYSPQAPPHRGPSDPLARDVALLSQAQQALNDGAPRSAVRTLDRLLVTSSDSAIAPEARALRIQALCAADRIRDAERAAQAFAHHHPDSALVDPRSVCPRSGATSKSKKDLTGSGPTTD